MKYGLTETKIRNAKEAAKGYKLTDGGGLYIWVSPTGAKSWRYNYKLGGSYKTLSIGTFPGVTIKAARDAHAEALELVATGNDPAAIKAAKKEEASGGNTFRDVAAEWLELRKKARPVNPNAKPSKTGNRDDLVVGYLNAGFGDKQVQDLTIRDLADVLIKFEEAGKFETRVRIQGAAVSIAGFAVGRGLMKTNPFLGVRFAESFTAPSGNPRPAIVNPEAFGYVLRKIEYFEGREGNITGLGLKLLALTFVRPGELAAGKWAHINFDECKWVVPPDELKMRTKRKKTNSPRAGKSHEVPLSRQAIALLRQLHQITGQSEYLFPGRQSARTISENTFNDALRAMGYQGQHCAHGFRSSASTILNDERVVVDDRKVLIWPYQSAIIEVQLDHDDDSTRAIYARGGHWEDRVELMQHWADLIDRLRSGKTPSSKPRLVAVA